MTHPTHAQTEKAIKKSIEHHQDNLRKLEREEIKEVLIDRLCGWFPWSCTDCPLCIHQRISCESVNFAYYNMACAETLPQTISATRNMVRVLGRVLEKFREGKL